MANNVFQIKRTSVSGRAANSSTLVNPGELALNMADGILYSTNGSVIFEIGANNTNVKITNTLTVNTISANGSVGSANQVLFSNGSSVYWANVASGGATAIRQAFTGNGSATVFTVSGGYTSDDLDVFLNGVKLLNGTEVDVSSGTTFTITPAPVNGSSIYVIGNRPSTDNSKVSRSGDTMTGNLVLGNTTISLNSIVVGNSTVNTIITAGNLELNGSLLTVGNSTINVYVNSTSFTGISNNTLFVGSVTAVNVVSNAQLSGNLANYVTTTNLTNNLANYQTTAGLNANIAAYLTTYTGTVNAASHTVGTAFTANATVVNAVSYYAGTTLIGNTTGPYGKTEATLNVNSALTANNSTNLGGTAAANYVQNTDSRTLSGNLTFSGAVTTFSGANISVSGTNLNVSSNANFTSLVSLKRVSETLVTLGNSGTATTIDLSQGTVFTSTLTGGCTFTIANAVNSSSFTLILTNDATPSRSVAWSGGTFRYPGGSITRTTTANAVDIWAGFTPDGGTTWYLNIPMKNNS